MLRRQLLLLAAFIMPSYGCGMTLHQPRLTSGQEYRAGLAGLAKGMSEPQVHALLGPPVSRLPRGRRAVAYYRVAYQRGGCDVYFLGVKVNGQPHDRYNLKLTFGPEGLEAALYRVRRPEGLVEVELFREPRPSLDPRLLHLPEQSEVSTPMLADPALQPMPQIRRD